MSEKAITSRKRFDVALSFPGEHRNFIEDVAKTLAQQLTSERVFYDNWYKAELARPNLDTYLQSIYRNDSQLIVVFSCADYEKKEWCGLEWRAICDLIKQKRDEAIMLFRFDETILPGLFSSDGYIDARNRKSEEIANFIIQRLARVDYTRLRDLLKAGKWKEADEETLDRMCEVMERQEESWLRSEDIQKFPCADLRIIDQLWTHYSNGKFGFSVQRKIWREHSSPSTYNAKWEKFGEVVGWKKKNFMDDWWKKYGELTLLLRLK